MKKRLIMMILCIIGLFQYADAQQPMFYTINYAYDAAGNRISRYTEVTLNKRDPRDTSSTTIVKDSAMQQPPSNTVQGMANSSQSITIYPNPTNGNIYLVIKGIEDNGEANAIVTDAYGKQLIEKVNVGENVQIDLTAFSSGLYFIHLIFGNEKKIYRINKI